MIGAPASKSFTAARARPQKNRISPLLWMNLVCLDAPLVAVSWQWLFARSFGAAIPRGATAALFLTAWLIYLADRFGDALSLGGASSVSLRQEFCAGHRTVWVISVAMIALGDFAVVATQLDRMAITFGSAVGAFAFVYLLINRLRPSVWRVLPLKEISIGFIFAAGAMVGLMRSLSIAALPAWLLFACLCALNCIGIAVWERELDTVQNRVSIATELPSVHSALLPALVGIFAISMAFAIAGTRAELHFCIALSAALLVVVHVLRARIQPDVRTALADLVLLTPLIPLLVWR
jgi:hypothetical protein